jgi:dihydrofolate reductase
MNQPVISLIAAIDKKRGLGKDNKLLFKIPEDLKRFKEITSGHVVIMGRKTYESIGHTLPERTNIVITRDESYVVEGGIVVHSFEKALQKGKELEQNEIFIIGGGDIYNQSMDSADKLYLTIVEGSYDADTFFPEYPEFSNVIFSKQEANGTYTYTFEERVRS